MRQSRLSSAVACLLFSLLVPGVLAAQSIVQVIPLPSAPYWNAAWGLTSADSFLYVSSNTSDATNGRKIMRMDLSGNVLDSVLAPPGVVSSQGLARDSAGNFYYLRRYTSACTIMKLSPSGAMLDSVRFPSGKYLGGLAWDGTHLWYSVYYPDAECGLYKMDFDAGVVLDTIPVPTLQPYGITWDGHMLFYAETGFQGDPRGIYIVDPVLGDTAGFIPEPPDGSSNGTNPHDVAWDGSHLWLLAEPVGASSGRSLYRYDLGGSGTPDINLTSSLLSFGGVRIGSFAGLSAGIQNTGNAPLVIDSIVVGLSASFLTGLATPLVVPSGGTVTLPVEFHPAGYGPDSASIAVYSNDPDEGVKRLAVRGFGIFADPQISAPVGFDFGARRVGSSNAWRCVVRNLGGGTLVVDSLLLANPVFGLDSLALPAALDSLDSVSLRVWFLPAAAGPQSDTLWIHSNAANGPRTPVALAGAGSTTPIPVGTPLWEYQVPDHPVSNTSRTVKGVRAIPDVTGDGKPDIILSTENYWTMAVNGNSSVTTEPLWFFTTYISNYSAGSIGSTGDYSYQKALAVARDLNGDGFSDVVIGTGGGNEHVYVLNGRTGQMLWTFGTDHPDSFGLGDFTGVDVARDFNGDGVPDVLAAASATESGGIGGRRSMYLFHGATGAVLWQSPLPGFTHGVTSIDDIDLDGIPDAIGTVGQPAYKFTGVSGATGNLLWDFTVGSSSGGGKEVMVLPVPGGTPDVVASAFWGPVYRLDAESGTQLWSYSTGGSGVLQLQRQKDLNGDGIDEVLMALLGGGARCVNGATGALIWSLPTGNTMGIAALPDLNQDGVHDVAIAVQNQGAMIVRGQDGSQLALFPIPGNQTREVAAVPDMDGNNSWEIIAGGNLGRAALLSGGVDAGPSSASPGEPLPGGVILRANYPNPFNPSTTISFRIPERADCTLGIFDLLGREVRSYAFERVPAGDHSLEWDGMDARGIVAASGVYFYRLRAGSVVLSRSMILLR
ncbi:MAG: choice-of-anchor D domain-containing protein [Bacteroidota bacterium]